MTYTNNTITSTSNKCVANGDIQDFVFVSENQKIGRLIERW